MSEKIEDKNTGAGRNRRVHMANERTFLAWIRTSVGIMAFGFVIEKSALLLKQMAVMLGETGIDKAVPPTRGFSAIIGIFLVGLGALMSLVAFVRYKQVERQIDRDQYRPSSILDILLTLFIVSIGIFLVVYLIRTP